MINIKAVEGMTLGEFIRSHDDNALAAVLTSFMISTLETFDIATDELDIDDNFNSMLAFVKSPVDEDWVDTFNWFSGADRKLS